MLRTKKDSQVGFQTFHGVQAALKNGNEAGVEKYAKILENKQTANDFIKRERMNRERDVRIQEKLRATNRLPPESLEEIEKDPDLGMGGGPSTPKLLVPTTVDPLYVTKPLGKYEPSHAAGGPSQVRGGRG